MIYLDNAATTPLDPAVAATMARYQTDKAGNASSIHRAGVFSAGGIERARATIAARINADVNEIVFTSGGTEGNNAALKGAAFALRDRGNHLITTAIEHSSILEPVRWLETQGFSVSYAPVDGDGFVDPRAIEGLITPRTVLVSVMHANNEIGTIEPIGEIGRLCRSRGILFHTDACQSFTKVPLDVKEQCLDLVTLNAHKIHGPRGVGALYVRGGIPFVPLLHGGGQENGLRSGTYNSEGIAGFGTAVEIAGDAAVREMTDLRDYLLNTLRARVPGIRLFGPEKGRLCNNLCCSCGSLDGKELFLALNRRDIIVSAGSACHAKRNTPSHVLLALGVPPEEAHRAVRLTLSRRTTRDELDRTTAAIAEIVKGAAR